MNFCQNDGCENPVAIEVPTSDEQLGDGRLELCQLCHAAYRAGLNQGHREAIELAAPDEMPVTIFQKIKMEARNDFCRARADLAATEN